MNYNMSFLISLADIKRVLKKKKCWKSLLEIKHVCLTILLTPNLIVTDRLNNLSGISGKDVNLRLVVNGGGVCACLRFKVQSQVAVKMCARVNGEMAQGLSLLLVCHLSQESLCRLSSS